MSDPYCGEIRMFAGTYAPFNWAFCDGVIMQGSDNTALLSLLGNIYGGDGYTTFGLPDLRGRLPMHRGMGTDLTNRSLGERYGTETVTLTVAQIPSHNHPMQASVQPAITSTPSSMVVLAAAVSPNEIYASTTDQTQITELNDTAVQKAGGAQSHSNLMPALCLNFIICLHGVYPSRN